MRRLSILSLIVAAACASAVPTYQVPITGSTVEVSVESFVTSDVTIVHDDHATHDILLIKDGPMAYRALYLKCTYDAKRLDPSSQLTVCPVCHSAYDIDGAVKKGPADKSLLTFPTELDAQGTLVRIDIEALGL